MSQELVTLTVDGKEVQAPKGMLLVEAAKRADIEVPVFCYHPKLDPAGVCRMCLVEVEGQRKPVTACTMPVADGMVVKTDTPLVQGLQKGVLEFLLLNHPLDCPVCDKGGECPLQDNTFKYGPATSRSLDLKERKDKAVGLGNFIVLDEERCILCRRCTRFDDEISQENHLVVGERAHEAMITTADGESFDSYFSGNTIELCPVGALTSDLYRFKARPWDLSRVPAVCTGCSVGCNVHLDFRYGKLLRILSRENPDIDDGWMCDRGRFNYQYVHSETRIQQPMIRRNGELVPVTWDEALAEVSLRMRNVRRDYGGGAIGAVGGGRLTNEEAYLYQKLARTVFGTSNVDWRVGEQYVASNREFPGRMRDISDAGGVLLVDILPAERAPVADLRIRRVAERGGATLAAVGPAMPQYRPECNEFPALPGAIPGVLQGDDLFDLYKGTERLAVLWSGRDEAVGEALVALLRRLKEAGSEVHLLIPGEQANAWGAEAMGVHPERLPGYGAVTDSDAKSALERAWQADLPEGEGWDTSAMLQKALVGELQALYIAGANLLSTYPDRTLAEAALDTLPFLVVQDLFLTETAQKADVVLPAASFPAKTGHYTTFDGTVQGVEQAMETEFDAMSDSAVFAGVAQSMSVKLYGSDEELAWEMQHLAGWREKERLDGAPAEMTSGRGSAVTHGAATKAGPPAAGPASRDGDVLALVPVERLYAGGGTSHFDEGIRHARPKVEATIHPEDAERLQLEAEDDVWLTNERASLSYTLKLDRSVIPGTVQVPKGLVEAPANAFGPTGNCWVSAMKPVAEEVG